ncbi:flagellar export chaperone FliS [Allochromatium vinosum]|uniref:Flagellar secretion chaperone FliS n=1 Tax=Allochromatium vinosum (strain ATCC 17899 / DSM 180 / NBRC 103801 / NCIMB 10441 / D) TaxID=572477 RepID=D3RUL9_ALLVD|nr:flagellar export chaperone FliS [Allochromatium vinosum]ADC62878.1 flagellar protein FliS [Allochromatium vinosum DSM 180]
MYAMRRELNQYRQAGPIAEIAVADPHRLTQMLFEGALERLAVARGAMAQGNAPLKGQKIGQAMEIIGELRGALDLERGGELAANLDSLYDYMIRRLVTGNARNAPEMLEEISILLREIKAGWDAIPEQMRKAS